MILLDEANDSVKVARRCPGCWGTDQQHDEDCEVAIRRIAASRIKRLGGSAYEEAWNTGIFWAEVWNDCFDHMARRWRTIAEEILYQTRR